MGSMVKSFYASITISDPTYLQINIISELMNVPLKFWEHSSALSRCNGNYIMHINESLNKQCQWQEFGHEMYHYFFDDCPYNQLNGHYAKYGETKADYFAYHFCVPTFMLRKIKGVSVYDVMELFNVEFDFALRRLEMYKSKCMERKIVYEGTHN